MYKRKKNNIFMKTNEQLKQEAISKAWIEIAGKEHFKKLKIDCNGWSKSNCQLFLSKQQNILVHSALDIPKGMPKKYQPTGSDLKYRPKSLSGIENNNGWIRVEPDGSNLPTDGEYVLGLLRDGIFANQGVHLPSLIAHYFRNRAITHYRPIEPLPFPIY